MASVVQDQDVAIVQRHGFGQVDENLVAMGELDHLATEMPLVMGEHRDVERHGPVGW